jgi:hypothetical protein
MAGLLSMPKPRGRRNEESLLGLSGDLGMTDSTFRNMGRAPVDELWAGRHSAVIDDDDFDEKVKLAMAAREEALSAKGGYMSVPDFQKPEAEDTWLSDAREYITDQSSLDIYPGHLRSDEKNPIFMSEFSDEGALLREGYMDYINKQTESGDGTYLADVFHHPELYKHYPESQFLPVFTNADMKEGHRGSYFRPNKDMPIGAMMLNPSILDDEKNRETLLHELQHFIQSAEGWEGGGMSGTEAGIRYAENLLDSGKTHSGHNHSPSAEEMADGVREMYKSSTEIMPFMKDQEVGAALAHHAYEGLSGEQLARDATARDGAGIQVENYYYGPTDRNEYANWNHTDATFKPMAAMPAIRQDLMERGLLGPILDEAGNPLKSDAVDPYVQKYMEALLEAGIE